MRRRRFFPVLDGGPGVFGVVTDGDDVSVPGVVNVDDAVELLVLVSAASGKFSVWIFSCIPIKHTHTHTLMVSKELREQRKSATTYILSSLKLC